MSTTDRYAAPTTEKGLRYGIIEVTTRCQFACPGCYMHRRHALNNGEMTLNSAIRILDLCQDYCGQELETMDILGGEPLLWPFLKEYINELLRRGIKPWIFTNMAAIKPELAHWLLVRQVHITGKLNIANPADPNQLDLQAEMIGSTVQMARKMIKAIDIFLDAGYQDPLFRLQNLARKKNLPLIPGYMQFCQSRRIGVDLELMGSGEPVGREYFEVAPTPQELARLIQKLGRQEEVLMPHVFGSCPFYDKGLYFAVDGHIRSCSNSTVKLASLDDSDPIAKAWESPLLCARRRLNKNNVGEPCHSCERWERCRGGCRATVEGMGDPFGGYTLCPVPYL